ncbi:MAG: 3-oxoacyl-[acyl-carrier-protein] reductase [Bdellovibrionales bacterium]|nr:3-oxoacyl-[acyl-carrier-protein] reductase [Bdellovibrionales bacterium]
MNLSGELALVTGASRGIGRSIAVALAKAGAEVIVNYVNSADKAKAVCDEIAAEGGRAMPLKFDVSKPEEIKAAVDTVLKDGKNISILVNNSGITRDGLSMRYSTEDWDNVLDTNLRGAFFTTQALMRNMTKARKGAIVNVSSIVGIMGNPGQAAYCASKAGLIGMTKSLAKELAPRNIRVNAVAPGYIETEMTDKLTEEQRQAMLKYVPLGRVAKPEEVAHAVVFLASSDASYITGQTLIVDGGMGM